MNEHSQLRGEKVWTHAQKFFHNPKLFHKLTASQISLNSGSHFNAIRLVAQVQKKKNAAGFSRLTQSSAWSRSVRQTVSPPVRQAMAPPAQELWLARCSLDQSAHRHSLVKTTYLV